MVFEVENDDDWEFEYEWLCEDLCEWVVKVFLLLILYDGWCGWEDWIFMCNVYVDFGLLVYGGLVVVWIVECDDGVYWDVDWCMVWLLWVWCWLFQIVFCFDDMFGDYDCFGYMLNGEGVYVKCVV